MRSGSHLVLYATGPQETHRLAHDLLVRSIRLQEGRVLHQALGNGA